MFDTYYFDFVGCFSDCKVPFKLTAIWNQTQKQQSGIMSNI